MDWTHVWDAAVVSQDVTSVLRVALDDSNIQVIAAAAAALHALLNPSAEETGVQSMAGLCLLTGGTFNVPQFIANQNCEAG